MRSPRLTLLGRPLRRAPAGKLALDAPACLETENGRIVSVRPFSGTSSSAALGHPDAVLAPALSDAHVHLAAAASARLCLDLAEAHPATLADLLRRIGAYAQTVASSSDWIQVRGFDASRLAEHRPPTADELEGAVPRRAVRLRDATLHASALSRTALERARQALGTARVRGGDPSAWVVGAEEVLGALCGGRDGPSLQRALAGLGRELAALGIGCVDEITATNDASRVALLADAVGTGALPQRVRVWLRDADELEPSWRAARGRVELAGVKLLARSREETTTAPFASAVARARAAGLPVAVHAVEPDVIDGALDALRRAPLRVPSQWAGVPDRLEHCSLCPPEVVRRVADAGVAVVTQPGFLVRRGAKYRREVESALWSWLYPIASLRRAGVLVAAGSDAPVIPPDPRLGFAGATGRRSAEGCVFGAAEAITEADALDLWTRAAARVRGDPDAELPWLRVGGRADVLVLAGDPTTAGLASWRVHAAVLRGTPHAGLGA